MFPCVLLEASKFTTHFDFTDSAERKKYYKHQAKAISFPKKYMSVIIDGIDQSKTHLPHWPQISKVRYRFGIIVGDFYRSVIM